MPILASLLVLLLWLLGTEAQIGFFLKSIEHAAARCGLDDDFSVISLLERCKLGFAACPGEAQQIVIYHM